MNMKDIVIELLENGCDLEETWQCLSAKLGRPLTESEMRYVWNATQGVWA